MNETRTDLPNENEAERDVTPQELPPREGPPQQDPPPENTARDTPPPANPGRGWLVAIGLFALLVAFAAAGGVAFTWWQVAGKQSELAEQEARATARLDTLQSRIAATQERLAEQGERIEMLNRESAARARALDGLDDELRETRATLEKLATEDAGPERSPALAEVEFLLLLARRELVLGDNPQVALAALREADRRLARLEGPGLRAARAAVNDEIAAIEAVADRDLEGVALRLASLARRIEGLPLRATLSPGPAGAVITDGDLGGWDRFKARLQALGTGLFRIRRTDAPAAPLLAPDESFFLYRNVELDLKSARLAALARDADNFAASLDSARRAVEQYFETGDNAVQAVLQAIEELEGHDIAPEWPEIGRALELLRAAGAGD